MFLYRDGASLARQVHFRRARKMSVLTRGVVAVIPNGAERIIRVAEENEWEAAATFVPAGSKEGRTVDGWVVGLEAYTSEGEVSLLLLWERGPRGFRYVAKESNGVRDGVSLSDMTLKGLTALIEGATLVDPIVYGECGCEDPEEVAEPRVCIEHAYFPRHGLSARWGWGAEITRNRDLAGWDEDGGTGGRYFEAVEGQEELTLADVVPAEVRMRSVPVGMPEPADVGDCLVTSETGFQGFCDSVGVRLYRVLEGRTRLLMCAQHAAERAGVPVESLPVLEMDAEERRYAADLIEDDRRSRVLRGAEEWAEEQERAEDGRTVPYAFEGWAEKNWRGDDFAGAFVAWLHATGQAADPAFAWAVSCPVDRVQQAAVRLERAQNALEGAQERHVAAQRSLSREGIARALDAIQEAHAVVADAVREHTAERAEAAGAGAVDVERQEDGERYRFGLPVSKARRMALVDGVLGGYVGEVGGCWYAVSLDGEASGWGDRESVAEWLVRRADARATETRDRTRTERSRAAGTSTVSLEAVMARPGPGARGRGDRVTGRCHTPGRGGGGRWFPQVTSVAAAHVTGCVTARVTGTRRAPKKLWGGGPGARGPPKNKELI
ncbi:hypothetical protein ACFY8C_38350 [Streptomyces flavochromogenes]|uniref:Uncharacterized protein n=1 Tax=Streptomyces flavochromogenes TaxID=68199 RepID=A0ABW6Y319_9ACTN